jgi:hypothetical protein
MFNEIRKGLSNLWEYLPLIWKDRQWDQPYFFTLLHKKLTLMEEHFRSKACFVGREREARKIKICVLLLDRLQKDDYSTMAFKNHERKFGELEITNSKIRYTKVNSKKEERECDKSFHKCYEHEQYLRNQDLDFLFNLIKKRVLHWWD